MLTLALLLGLLVGGGLSTQSVVGAVVTRGLGTIWGATLISFIIGTVSLSVVTLVTGGFAPIKLWSLHPIYWVASGILGMFMVVGRTFLVPQVGTAVTMVLVIVGQLVSSVLMDHYGWLATPQCS